MYILGIGLTHNSTACLLKNGEVIGCVSEERFTREKNYTGYPEKSIDYLLKNAGISLDDLDLVAHSFINSLDPTIVNKSKYRQGNISKLYSKIGSLLLYLPFLDGGLRKLFHIYNNKNSEKILMKLLCDKLTVGPDKILLVNHHMSHAYAAYYGFACNKFNDAIIFTHDGEGDGECATVNVVNHNNNFSTISITDGGNSLAGFYAAVTKHLGMKVGEHEYKVMGLAPYASKYEVEKVLKRIEGIIKIDGLKFKSKFGYVATCAYLKKNLTECRFDGIAGAAQKRTEDLVELWVTEGIKTTKKSKIVLGGGLFMNVKANMRLMYSEYVDDLIICPSAGDESTPIGAAYFGYEKLCKEKNIKFNPKQIENLYLGPTYSNDEIFNSIIKSKSFDKFKVQKVENIEELIARYLCKHKIVARFNGRMEFGARSLGNRSIIANPSNPELIRILNEQIKNRDFWMPFASTILDERQADYLMNPKNVNASFMVLAFDTTELGKKHLKAAIHPYDQTVRPQILKESDNSSYYNIVKCFEQLTGIGAVLNTSFNLHGEPVVCTPDDAISVFERSGLKHLAIGNYIVIKGE